MTPTRSLFLKLAALSLATLLGAGPSLAEKPAWAGEKHGNSRDDDRRDDRRDSRYDDDRRGGGDRHRDDRRDDRHGDDRYRDDRRGSVEIRFGGNDRDYIRDYYSHSIRSGGCPPGLAKKNNGCLPPGQAKKWRRGAPLPRDVQIYDLPRDLSIRLGTPPAGYRYVRAASDILLITVGTSMVVDAIEDLGGLR